MSKLRGARPSPALVISLAALFVALGGTAWAAHKIGSKEISAGAITPSKLKNGAVTTAKLRDGAVTGPKIAPGAVGGRQLDESSLGTVPSAVTAQRAVRADSAATADHAGSADSAASFERFAASPVVKAGIGQEVTIMQRGPFTFVGRCINGGGGSAEAVVIATTSQPGSTFSSTSESHAGANFEPGEENQVGPAVASIHPATNDTTGGNATRFTALSADGGVRLEGEATAAVNYFGAACAFWGWTLNSG